MNIMPYTYRKPEKLGFLDVSKVDSIAIHNTGACNTINTDTDWHIDNNNWSWNGYGYYIDIDGTTYQVRGYKYINAGVKCHNSHIISIALRGNFNESPPTLQQLESLRKLIKKLKLEIPNIKYVNGHKHWVVTSCPGEKFPLSPFVEGGVTVVRLHTIGSNVTKLQEKLNKIGYTLEVDGVFGKKTEKAVMDLQKQNNLTVDGIVGEETGKFIDNMIERMNPAKKDTLEDRVEKIEKFLMENFKKY